MSAKKKPYKSIFSQYSNVEIKHDPVNSTSTENATKSKRLTRSKSATTLKESNGVINLDSDEEPKETATQTTPSTNTNWIEAFSPANSEELAIHTKKLQELEQWFKHCLLMKQKRQPVQICLLTGPSGCGKTAAVRTLAKEMEYSIQEWTNPVDQEIVYKLGDQVYGESNFTSSQADAFKGFLFKASRYRSLLELSGGDRRLLLVEDFPNFLLRDSSSFEQILDDYLIYGKAPLIFVVADSKRRGLNISYNIFSDQLKQKFLINHIGLNPIATTIMQTAMKRFCNLMKLPPHNELYRAPTSEMIDSIIVSAQGDIRNALINLHFSSLKGAPCLLTKPIESAESSQESKKTTRKRKGQSMLKSVGRDESLTMMHALGRIFNPKYTDANKLLHSPEDLSEAFATEPKKLLDFIHANYLHHFKEIDFVMDAANGLSLSELILNEYREDALALTGLNLAIRNIMTANKVPVTGWMPIKGPKRLNTDSKIVPNKASRVLPTHHNISRSLYAVEYATFVNIIAAAAVERE